MCLSNIYLKDGDNKELLFKNAANIDVKDNLLLVSDIMGRQSEIEGHVESVDLMENIILISRK